MGVTLAGDQAAAAMGLVEVWDPHLEVFHHGCQRRYGEHGKRGVASSGGTDTVTPSADRQQTHIRSRNEEEEACFLLANYRGGNSTDYGKRNVNQTARR
jgi:hypothetical protein